MDAKKSAAPNIRRNYTLPSMRMRFEWVYWVFSYRWHCVWFCRTLMGLSRNFIPEKGALSTYIWLHTFSVICRSYIWSELPFSCCSSSLSHWCKHATVEPSVVVTCSHNTTWSYIKTPFTHTQIACILIISLSPTRVTHQIHLSAFSPLSLISIALCSYKVSSRSSIYPYLLRI